ELVVVVAVITKVSFVCSNTRNILLGYVYIVYTFLYNILRLDETFFSFQANIFVSLTSHSKGYFASLISSSLRVCLSTAMCPTSLISLCEFHSIYHRPVPSVVQVRCSACCTGLNDCVSVRARLCVSVRARLCVSV